MYCKPPKCHPKTGGVPAVHLRPLLWISQFVRKAWDPMGWFSPHLRGAKLWLPNLCFFWLFLDWFLETFLVRIQATLGAFSPKKMEWVFPKIGVPQNGWFRMENPIKMDDLGVPLFLETPRCASLWVWSLGVFLAPYQLVRTTKLCISNLSACNCRSLSQEPIDNTFQTVVNKRKTQSWRNLGCLGTCQIRFKRKRKLLHI